MNADEERLFTRDEVKLLANRWKFWQGLFIGALGMLAILFAIGLYFNY